MALVWYPISLTKRRRWPGDSTFEHLKVQRKDGRFNHAWRFGPFQINFGWCGG